MTSELGTADRLPLDNAAVADRLERIADTLYGQESNPHRVRAYRTAANTLRNVPRPVAELLAEGGRAGLEDLPGVGKRLSQVIEQLTLTGHAPTLEAALGGPAAALATVGGIGPGLANVVRDRLGVTTLEELERAAYDGRLAAVPGFGPKRVRGVREALAGRFRRPTGGPAATPPSVADVLAVDAAYREKATAGQLRRVAPRRFNPTAAAWLPVLRVRRCGYSYRAMFSNTPVAHKLGRVRDWVVVYYGKDGGTGQCTVVTAPDGPLVGRRVVRGREVECARHYDAAGRSLFADAA
jgi:DNA polymerase (family 10)